MAATTTSTYQEAQRAKARAWSIATWTWTAEEARAVLEAGGWSAEAIRRHPRLRRGELGWLALGSAR